MKITIDVRMLHSSGIGIYIQNIVPRIIRLRHRDRFCLIGRAANREDPAWKGLPAFQWVDCQAPIYSLRQQWELKWKIPKETDLLWIPHYDIPVFFKGRLMVTVHDLFHLAMTGLAGSPLEALYARWMFKQAGEKASAIAAISQFTKEEWARWVGVGETKIRVIHNGVDASWFAVELSQRPHPKPYFLCVGNIKPHKNLKRLLEAFGAIQGQISHDLLLVGRKEGFLTGDREVQESAARFGDRVQFTGEVPLDRLRQYFAHAEALVFPSLYEGFGMPPLEAMALGCPTVVSSAASIPEVCGEATLYFDPFDTKDMALKMLRLVREKDLRAELVAKGKIRAKAFSWETCAGQTSGLLDQATGKS